MLVVASCWGAPWAHNVQSDWCKSKKSIMNKWKNYYGKKVWTVNASNAEWVECHNIKKTGTIVQLDVEIHQVRCKLDTLQKNEQTNKHQLESSL
jgi:hypothetical protein